MRRLCFTRWRRISSRKSWRFNWSGCGPVSPNAGLRCQSRKRLLDRNLELTLDDSALDRLSEAGYDPVYGARPLKRAIQQQVENPLAQAILAGKFNAGDRIHAKANGNGLEFVKQVARA